MLISFSPGHTEIMKFLFFFASDLSQRLKLKETFILVYVLPLKIFSTEIHYVEKEMLFYVSEL